MENTATKQSTPLGNTTRFATPPLSGRVRRFALQAIARELLPKERIRACYRHLRHVEGQPAAAQVWYSPAQQKAHYGGLMVCGSVWVCPVCASKITERRRVELAGAISQWPGSIFMATFTLQHTREDTLLELREHLKEAYSRLKSGEPWKRFKAKYGVVGTVTGLECTYSLENGWHPHLHVLFFSSLKPDQIDYKHAEKTLQERFTAMLGKLGRYSSPIYGVRLEKPVEAATEGDSALKQYVSKWGLDSELAKSPVKSARDERGIQHFSPFQLLEAYAAGAKWAGLAFQEYAKAMKGSKQLGWSPGLRSLLGVQVQEKTDLELAEEKQEKGDVLLAFLSWPQWRVVLANDARGELLQAADSGDPDRVISFLESLGLTVTPIGSRSRAAPAVCEAD